MMENSTNVTLPVFLPPAGDPRTILVNVIGLAFSLYSTISTVYTWVSNPPGTSVVRIKAGTSIDRKPGEVHPPRYHLPDIILYDEFGNELGGERGMGTTIPESGGASFVIKHTKHGYPHHLSLFQTIDEDKQIKEDNRWHSVKPICISAIWLFAGPDLITYGWTGDIGASCGAQWYYSDTVVGADGFKPPCVWIGRNHRQKGGFLHGGMSMQITGFQATPQRQAWVKENPKALCDSPARFSLYTYLSKHHSIPTFKPPLTYYNDEARNGIDNRENRLPLSVDWALHKHGKHWQPTGARDTTLSMYLNPEGPHVRRDLGHSEELLHQFKEVHEFFKTTLITSNSSSHSARALCESASSVGPDFVSLSEDLFCDMSQKKLLAICKNSSEQNCFDREFNSTHDSEPRDFLIKRGSSYTNFEYWR